MKNDLSTESESNHPRNLIYVITTVIILTATLSILSTINKLSVDYYNLNSIHQYFNILNIGLCIILSISCIGVFVRKRWGWVVLSILLTNNLLSVLTDFKYYLKSYSISVLLGVLVVFTGILVFYNTSVVISWFGIDRKNIARFGSLLMGGIILLVSTYFTPYKRNETTSSIYLSYSGEIAFLDSAKYSGSLTDYYNNGEIKTRGNYVDGIQQGYWEEFFDNSQRSKSCTYKDGKLIEKFLEYYPNGTIRSESSYIKGLKHGSAVEFYSNKQIKSLKNYKDGVVDGESKTWLENGFPDEVGSYKNGQREGLWKAWIEGSLFLEENYNHDKRDGLAKYYQSGKLEEEGYYRQGQKHGIWRQFNAQGGVMSVDEYREGILIRDK